VTLARRAGLREAPRPARPLRAAQGVIVRTPSLLVVLAALQVASLTGCSDPPTPPPTAADASADAGLDATPDVSQDAAPDATPDGAIDVATDARAEAGVDAADATPPPDAASEAGADVAADVAADASCAGAVAGGSCGVEGSFCGGPCTDPCSFCNVVRCVSGRWARLEVPPLPPDMCRDAGADADVADGGGLNCDPRTAACDSLPPPCMGGGEVREVRGACWGACVVYDRCRPIPCDPAMPSQCPTNTVCFRTTRLCGLPVR
jgi:hypothetical protein